jgi:hypothetical protein
MLYPLSYERQVDAPNQQPCWQDAKDESSG